MERDSKFKKVGKKLFRRAGRRGLIRAVPILGPVYAGYRAAGKIQRKGLLRGGADAALDMTPVVGRVKAVYEFVADKELISAPTVVEYPVSPTPA